MAGRPGAPRSFASLGLRERVRVGELLAALAVESHRFRTHSAASVAALSQLGRARDAEVG